MSGANVLVFGATGAVGGAAAQEAAERGAKVWLATRDPAKPISWLTKEQESDGTYTRVTADLSDPASVAAAVKKSGAKSAFVYIAHGISSKGAFQALKEAGITWVSLLSSFTIEGDLTKYKPESFIPYHHARGELDLQEAGIAYAAVRPGFFASNVNLFYVPAFKATGELNLVWADEVKYDFIVPKNIGQVAGALLTQPKPDLKPTEPEIVYVYGPELISMRESGYMVGKAMGKEVKVNSISEEAYSQELQSKKIPLPMINYLINQAKLVTQGGLYQPDVKKIQAETIKKYSGKDPITFQQWLDSIKPQLQG